MKKTCTFKTKTFLSQHGFELKKMYKETSKTILFVLRSFFQRLKRSIKQLLANKTANTNKVIAKRILKSVYRGLEI
jgi:hypothetical protein